MRLVIPILMTFIFVMSFVALGGIIIDIFTLTKTKKYVRLMGNYSFQNVKQFFISSMIVFGISCLCFVIFIFCGVYSVINSGAVPQSYTSESSPVRGGDMAFIRAVFCHIFCIAAGFMTINGYKTAKKSAKEYELSEEKSNLPKSVICEDCGKINKSVNKYCVCCGKELSKEKKSG